MVEAREKNIMVECVYGGKIQKQQDRKFVIIEGREGREEIVGCARGERRSLGVRRRTAYCARAGNQTDGC